jgi:hypothetical protein
LSGAPVVFWQHILDEAQRQGKIDALLALAIKQAPACSDLAALRAEHRSARAAGQHGTESPQELPESEDFAGPIAGGATGFPSCFISYSTKDQEFAKRLHADLEVHNVPCWFAPEDVQGGRKLHEQIVGAISTHDKLLLVLSEHSMGSEWVKTEIYHARQGELRRNSRILFPISLVPFEAIRQWRAFDADTGKDMGREVREYFIPDFSNWKDRDAYKYAFDRLLRDLKGSATG